jgi:hypothetical protein
LAFFWTEGLVFFWAEGFVVYFCSQIDFVNVPEKGFGALSFFIGCSGFQQEGSLIHGGKSTQKRGGPFVPVTGVVLQIIPFIGSVLNVGINGN